MKTGKQREQSMQHKQQGKLGRIQEATGYDELRAFVGRRRETKEKLKCSARASG